jgi:hypothetical protein
VPDVLRALVLGRTVPREGEELLRAAAAVFALAVIVHNSDHLRRGVDRLSGDVFAIGTLGIVLEVALVVLVFQSNRYAPLACVVGGGVLAVGYVEVHFLPAHSFLSDSFTSASHTALISWIAASGEIAAALLLALAGAQVLRASGRSVARADGGQDHRALLDTLTDPVPAVLLVSQVVAVIVSLTQRLG